MLRRAASRPEVGDAVGKVRSRLADRVRGHQRMTRSAVLAAPFLRRRRLREAELRGACSCRRLRDRSGDRTRAVTTRPLPWPVSTSGPRPEAVCARPSPANARMPATIKPAAGVRHPFVTFAIDVISDPCTRPKSPKEGGSGPVSISLTKAVFPVTKRSSWFLYLRFAMFLHAKNCYQPPPYPLICSKRPHENPQSCVPGRRPRHPCPPRDQGHAEGNAHHRRPAADPVRGGRGAGSRDRALRVRHRPQQGRDRGSLRPGVRARCDACASGRRRPRWSCSSATSPRPAP